MKTLCIRVDARLVRQLRRRKEQGGPVIGKAAEIAIRDYLAVLDKPAVREIAT